MSVRILGISACNEESAAVIVVDGEIVAASEEARVGGMPKASFPAKAIETCLSSAALSPEDIGYAVFYDRPRFAFEAPYQTSAHSSAPWPRSFREVPRWVRFNLHRPWQMRRTLAGKCRARRQFISHAEAHAAAAFFPSPFDNAAILLIDESGARESGIIAKGNGSKVEIVATLNCTKALRTLYRAFTSFSGFHGGNAAEHLVALAPSGEPRYAEAISEKMLRWSDDGSLRLSSRFIGRGGTLGGKGCALLGGAARLPNSPITKREMDIAASVQQVAAEIFLRQARRARELTNCHNLCVAGSLAHLCIATSSSLKQSLFDDIWIPPMTDGASAALGAALFAQFHLFGRERRPSAYDSLKGGLLGPRFTNEEIHGFLRTKQIVHDYFPDEAELLQKTVEALRDGKSVGWLNGKTEFSQFPLGARSILRDTRATGSLRTENAPVAGVRCIGLSVLVEDTSRFFELDRESPYMEFVGRLRDENAPSTAPRAASAPAQGRVRSLTGTVREAMTAGTAYRVHTVDERRCGRFYRLIREFKRQTGIGLLVNAELRPAGSPVANTPQDAYRCFVEGDLDMLVLENCVVYKERLGHPSKLGGTDRAALQTPVAA